MYRHGKIIIKTTTTKRRHQKTKNKNTLTRVFFLYPSVIESFSCFVYAHIAHIRKTKQKNKEEKKQA